MDATRRGLLAGAGTLLLPAAARAQGQATGDWPTRPIRLVVPFAAGGAADSAARAITPVMAQRLGQTIVVENRTGAGGSVGGGAVAAAPGDGYTLLWDASSHLVNPALMKGLPFDYASFVPVSLVVSFPGVLAVKADFPGRSVAEFIRQAKERPGAISVGTQGNATAGHVGLLQFTRRAGIEVIHAPYRGGADAARDLAAGAIDAVFITTVSAGPIVDSGRARFLAVATLERVPSRPDVPTLAESGFPGFNSNEWAALFGPAGLPAPIVGRLHAALAEALADPGVKQRLAQIGAVPVGSAPDDFARFVRDGRAQMAALVKEAGIRLD
jgi:tripartite-type tricarboxylate transporter receptor subunit TctC